MSIGNDYLNTAIRRLKYYRDLGEKALEQLSEEQFHYSPNSTVNSVAITIQHLAGNMMSRWTNFLTEDGEKDWRERDEEFESHAQSKAALMAIWHQGWDLFLQTLEGLEKKDLKKIVSIRKEPLTVIDAINRQMAHYPYHIGQIITMAKIIKAEDWQNLSIPKKASAANHAGSASKDPARNY